MTKGREKMSKWFNVTTKNLGHYEEIFLNADTISYIENRFDGTMLLYMSGGQQLVISSCKELNEYIRNSIRGDDHE